MGRDAWLDGLTENQRKGLEGCGSPEEAAAYCAANGINLPDELLEGIAGGGQSPAHLSPDMGKPSLPLDGHLNDVAEQKTRPRVL